MPINPKTRLITGYKPIDKGYSRYIELTYNDGAVMVMSKTTLKQRMTKLASKDRLPEAEKIARILQELYD
jgi:hypothetical protein